jgi:NAD(P)-dependent dehydrogenase (short-subunit alcohol dehydrogenase family)
MPTSQAVVLITGCSSGIGRALALAFAQQSFQVVATARRMESIKDLSSTSIHCLELDVTKAASIASAVQDTITKFGQIDYLINNAGFLAAGPVIETPLEVIRKQLETNVIGPIALAQAVAPQMLQQKSGRIVNVGSVSATLITPFGGIYSGSKADLHALSEAMRLELAPFGIQVLTVAPGAIASDLANKATITIREDSIYQPIASSINDRATMSQGNSTPSDEFAALFVREVTKANPRPMIKIGKGSKFYIALAKYLPRPILDKMRNKRFHLNDLP